MAATTDLRAELVTALQLAVDQVPVFGVVPPALPLPCVVLLPASDYITPYSISNGTKQVQINIGVAVPALDNAAAFAQCEQLAEDVIAALPAGVAWTRVSGPQPEDLQAQGTAVTALIETTARVS